jgi:signal transduction histidine kinase
VDTTDAGAVTSPPQLVEDYLTALLQGERRRAVQLIHDAVDAGLSVETAYLEVFAPALREIGRRWACGEATVAQEHLVTSATQVAMAQLYPRIVEGPRNGAHVVVAAIGGERHEIGGRMVADLFELHGWEAHFLGADTPTEDLVRLTLDSGAVLVALSATMSEAVPKARQVIEVLREVSDVPVLVGGRPFLRFPDLWRSVGASGTAPDARSAIAMGAVLAGLSDDVEAAVVLAAQSMPWRDADGLLHLGDETDERAGTEPRVGRDAAMDELSVATSELATLHRTLSKQAAELDRANARKDALLGMAAHDLRSPLTSMIGFTWALRRLLEDQSDPQLSTLLDRIERSTSRMLSLVEDLLETAVLADGTVQLDRAPVDLVALVREVVASHAPGAREKGVAMHTDAPGSLEVDLDDDRIMQVLDNLLSNAVKFSPADRGATVTVTVVDDGDDVTVSVRDEGIGIGEEFLPLLFEPFAHEHPGGTAGESCTGLGLSITRALVAAHGGSIEADSEPGAGTTFTVRLPRS